ncbi:SSI family serine proteinase inhibitor [Saccharopolyspora sp. 5N102]|uniref:SSI family serine proteinase inhibitor n=1 Tax=Saccharopolyspora sp. 5N102 TaxID=3375155 RepID=UPI0037BC7AAC
MRKLLAKLTRRVLLATALTAGTMATVAAVAPAQGETPSTVRLSLDNGRGAALGNAVLTCHPAGGTHKNAAKACSDLDAVGADFRLMTAKPAMACTLQYQPVTAKLEGNWRGRTVSFTETYPNSCVLTVETGVVFDF